MNDNMKTTFVIVAGEEQLYDMYKNNSFIREIFEESDEFVKLVHGSEVVVDGYDQQKLLVNDIESIIREMEDHGRPINMIISKETSFPDEGYNQRGCIMTTMGHIKQIG